MCTWSNDPGRINTHMPTVYIKRLEERIQQLERRDATQPVVDLTGGSEFEGPIQDTTDACPSSGSGSAAQIQPAVPSSSSQGTTLYSLSGGGSCPQTTNPNAFAISIGNTQAYKAQTADDASPYDDRSVHAIIGATLDEQYNDGFFGSSSAGSFMQTVKTMVEQSLTGAKSPGQPFSRRVDDHQPLLFSSQDLNQKHMEYVLPLRKSADLLMSLYWKQVHVLYPFLDKAQMQEEYNNLWSGDGKVSDARSLLCLLNVIFALSSQMDSSTAPEERERIATSFYLRALELLDLLGTGSVRSVQLFLLLGMYCQSTNNSYQCWTFIGLGIRTAQSLGLHLPETSERAPDIRTREMLRKVWHGCILMDRALSMTYGRPCGIGSRTANAVPPPLALDEELLLPGAAGHITTEENCPSVLEFYIFSLRLYKILHDILYSFNSPDLRRAQSIDEIYDNYFGHSTDQSQFSILDLDRRLALWEKSLPDHLRVGRSSSHDDLEATFYRQAIILHQR